MKKIIITSWLRVGSTLVSDILRALQNRVNAPDFIDVDRELGSTITTEELDFLTLDSYLFKTHSYCAMELVNMIPKEVHVVGVKRNFLDAFVSYILYNRNVRLRQGLSVDPRIKDIILEEQDMPDDTFINYCVETKSTWAVESLHHWANHSSMVMSSNCTMIDYDRYIEDIPGLVQQLNKIVKANKTAVARAIDFVEFDKMKSRYEDGFIRRAVAGGYQKYLDPFALNFLVRHIKNLKV